MTIIVGNSYTSTNKGGVIQYNGYVFYSPMFRSHLELIPKESNDGRTVTYNLFRLTVRGFVTDIASARASHAKSGSDRSKLVNDQYNARSNLQRIQAALTANGGNLIISGLGMDININGGDGHEVFDVRFGPKTKILRFEPVGNGVVWQTFWVCEFAIPTCPATSYLDGSPDFTAGSGLAEDVSYLKWPLASQGVIDSCAFDVGYSIDKFGLTRRVISGQLTVALNRASVLGSGAPWKVEYTADEAREQMNFIVPDGFQRIEQSWNTSPDRTTLKFTVIDEELPTNTYYPPGVVNMHLEHTVHAVGEYLPVMNRLYCNFNGFIEIAKTANMGDAFKRVVVIMQERLDIARAAFVLANPDPNAVNNIFIKDVTLTETVVGQPRLTFSLSYVILGSATQTLLGDIVGRSGLLTQTYATSWAEWADSLANTHPVWRHRGFADLKLNADTDYIVGPCDAGIAPADDTTKIPLSVLQDGGSLTTQCPDNAASYLMWYPTYEVSVENGQVLSNPMADAPSPGIDPELVALLAAEGANLAPNYREGADGLGTNTAYAFAASVVHIIITVMALRLGKDCEIPAINTDKFYSEYTNGRLSVGDTQVKMSRLGKIGQCTIHQMEAVIPCTVRTNPNKVEVEEILGSLQDALTKTDDDPDGEKVGGTTND